MKKYLIPLMILLAAPAFARPLIIAHRCGGGLAPENTVAAAKNAWKIGADLEEIDVRITKDGKAVLCHDENIMRYTGVDKNVADATFAELRKLDFGSYFDKKFAGEKIATLQEYLATVPKGKLVMYDLKCGGDRAVEIISACVKAAHAEDSFLVLSDPDTIRAFRKTIPETKALGHLDNYSIEDAKRLFGELGSDDAIFNGWEKGPEFAEKASKAGLNIWAWTIDDVDKAKELVAHGTAGLITNRPDLMLAAFPDVKPVTRRPNIMGHRGVRALAPENTLVSFKMAWDMGADMIETDLWMTKDKKIVLCHENNVKRVAGVDLKITDATFTQLRALDFGSHKGKEFAGEKIPTLQEALMQMPAGKKIALEIKDERPEMIPITEKVIDACGVRDRVRVISFCYEAVANSKKQMPDVPAYYLMSVKGKIDWQAKCDQLKKDKIDGFSIENHMINDESVAIFRANKMPFMCGVTNTAELAKKMAAYGPGWICTDNPSVLIEAFK